MDENLTNGKYRVDRLNGDGKLAVVKIYQTIPTAASTDQPDGKADIDVVRFLDSRDVSQKCLQPQRRYVVCFMTFFGLFFVYALRLNLTVAIVPMTTANRSVRLSNGTIIQAVDFDWSPKEKGYVLSSFFYGYILSELPGGWLSARYGGTRIMGFGILLTACLALLIPAVANCGPIALTALRATAGVCEGGAIPCIHAIWSRWAPSNERTLLVALSTLGIHTANIVCPMAYGSIAYYWGWPLLFYIPGITALIWCYLWFQFIKSDPEDDPWITAHELRYLQNTTGKKKRLHTIYPWKSIVTSKPVWAIVCANFVEGWGYITIFTQMPTFINSYYNINVKESGFLLSIPYVVAVLVIPLIATAADYLKTKNYSTTLVRKVFNSVACVGQAISIALMGYSESAYVTTILCTLWMCFDCAIFAGFYVNNIDIAPAYASILMGISNTVGNMAGVICPTVAGYIVASQGIYGWRTIFLICSAFYLIGGVFYLIFASGKPQEWARNDEVSKPSELKHDEMEQSA